MEKYKKFQVVDMGAVVDVITALEKTTITKEVLEVITKK